MGYDGKAIYRSDSGISFFTEEVNQRLAKRLLKTNRRLAIRGLTSLVKDATVHCSQND